MRHRTTAALSASHALAIGLGLVQQVAFAAVFGVTPAAGLFALAITPAVVTALIYAESLQVTLLPALVRAGDEHAKAAALAGSLRHAAALGVVACAIGLLWGCFVMGQAPTGWPVYGGFVVSLSIGHVISMAASSLLVWLQADRQLVLPSTVHLIPGVLGTVAILVGADLAIVAAAYVGIGVVQCAWLAGLSPALRSALARIGERGWRAASSRSASMPRLSLQGLAIGAAVPLLQFVDRLARGAVDLPGTAAASYAWAITLGLAAVIARGPGFAQALFVASEALAPRRRTFAFPLGVYALGLALGALTWSVARRAAAPLLERWPEQAPLVDALAVALPQLLLCVAPVAALPSLYRILVRLSSVQTGARFVAWQFLGQAGLAAAAMTQPGGGLVGYSAALAANLSFAALLIMTLRLHASAAGNRSAWS
jgi:hypothetical protein